MSKRYRSQEQEKESIFESKRQRKYNAEESFMGKEIRNVGKINPLCVFNQTLSGDRNTTFCDYTPDGRLVQHVQNHEIRRFDDDDDDDDNDDYFEDGVYIGNELLFSGDKWNIEPFLSEKGLFILHRDTDHMNRVI